MDPNSEEFDELPPHWTLVDPMANEHVAEAMTITFGNIMVAHPEFTAVLLRCLPCIIYHQDKLQMQIFTVPGHDFNKLQLLTRSDLLDQLKPLITIDSTEGVMDKPTGIPPHVSMKRQLKTVLDRLEEVLQLQRGFAETVKDAVNDILEERAVQAGTPSLSTMTAMIEEKFSQSERRAREGLQEATQQILQGLRSLTTVQTDAGDGDDFGDQWGWDENDNGQTADRNQSPSNTYCYDGHIYAVPKDFIFPKVNIWEGLRFWFRGQIVSDRKFIIPFRNLQGQGRLPSKQLRDIYKLNWKQLFGLFEKEFKNIQGWTAVLPRTASDEDLSKYYNQCKQFLQLRASYYYKNGINLDKQISTWSNKVQRANILKFGSPSDKARISSLPVSKYQRPKPRGSKRKRSVAPRPRYLRR